MSYQSQKRAAKYYEEHPFVGFLVYGFFSFPCTAGTIVLFEKAHNVGEYIMWLFILFLALSQIIGALRCLVKVIKKLFGITP